MPQRTPSHCIHVRRIVLLFVDKYVYPKPRKQDHTKLKQLKDKHKKKLQQLKEDYDLKVKQMKESQALELKNAKSDLASMVEKEDEKKKKKN